MKLILIDTLHANEEFVTVALVEAVFDILNLNNDKTKVEWDILFQIVELEMQTDDDPQMKIRMVTFFRGLKPSATSEEINTSLVSSENFTPK